MRPKKTKCPPRIVPLNKLPSEKGYEHWKEPTLRQWVFYAQARYNANGTRVPNGFDVCLIRIGRRIYINLDSFDEWLLSHQKSNSLVIA